MVTIIAFLFLLKWDASSILILLFPYLAGSSTTQPPTTTTLEPLVTLPTGKECHLFTDWENIVSAYELYTNCFFSILY